MGHTLAYQRDAFKVVVESGGDVLARYQVRAREIAVSTAVVMNLTRRLAGSTGTGRTVDTRKAGAGFAQVEAWRGTLVHRVELGPGGELTRGKVVDPSFSN